MLEYLPALQVPTHCSSPAFPTEDEYFPASHFVHCSSAERPVRPLACLPAEQRPRHCSSEMERPVEALHFPTEQLVHWLPTRPEAALHFPAAQFVHMFIVAEGSFQYPAAQMHAEDPDDVAGLDASTEPGRRPHVSQGGVADGSFQ